MKKTTLLFAILYCGMFVTGQQWQQTAATPEGAGVTEIVINPVNENIFVTTASFNWPSGDDGGVRRSTDDGDSWENLFDAYAGRTISYCADGYLYASIWPYPQDEGLYRSTDNGDTWNVLITVPSGNNIFSVTVSTATNPYTLFAGTRQGVYRSLDNGATWAYSSSGIPADAWVRDIEVDQEGIVAAATHSGLFISEDNGNNWQMVTGGGIENEMVTKLLFDNPTNGKGETRLLTGTGSASVYESFSNSKYLVASLMVIFGDGETAGFAAGYLMAENKKMHGVATFPDGTQPGGFSCSTDNGTSWQPNNNGLPGTSPPTSALATSSNEQKVSLKVGLFQNMNGGAKVYKTDYEWSTISGTDENWLNLSSIEYLGQNYPNPCDRSTVITYSLKNAGQTRLELFASDGRLIRILTDGWQSTGEHRVTLNTEDLVNAVYYYKLTSKGIATYQKMLVVR